MPFYAVLIIYFLQLSLCAIVTGSQFRDGDLRLVGGSYQWEGRVEIFYSGSWGSITDPNWTSEDAAVACRMMGYFIPGASEHPGAYFGQGSGPIHFDHVQCSGTEYNLTDCETGSGTRQSSHEEDVGVKCNTIDESYHNGDVRLVGGAHNWEGRVEILWNGAWGTISDSTLDLHEAKTICKQLGLSENVVSYCCAQYGQGTGQVHGTECPMNATSITQCSTYIIFPSSHDSDVGIKCGEGTNYKSGDIRLVGGRYSWEGRVEVYLNGEWGTVSSGCTDSLDAHVVCGQLGYDTRYGYFDLEYNNAHFGPGVGAIHFTCLICSGTEHRLVDCSSSQYTYYTHNNDWSVTCKNDFPEEGEVKLFYRTYLADYYRGLLQVWLNGRWGTVSDYFWTTDDARSVCRQLGRDVYSTSSTYYGHDENLPVVMSNVNCLGTESRLIDCSYNIGGSGSPVSLQCTYDASCRYGDIRLAGRHSEYEGRVEFCSSRPQWGTVCNTQWTQTNSQIVCRSLGYSDQGSYQASYGNNTQSILPTALDYVKCNGSEDTLRGCIHFSHSYGCSHDQDVGVHCQPANCDDGDVKLIGGLSATDGYVAVCYNKRWGHICDNYYYYYYYYREANAKTICKQLGFSGGIRRYSSQQYIISSVQNNISLSCSGEESRIFDCAFDTNTQQSCYYYYLNVECTPALCVDGEVRLVDGDRETEGRVEVCFSRRWGTINGDGWTMTESTVVCNDLGYEATGRDYSARPATNSMPVFVNDASCSGIELSLLECSYSRDSSSNHTKDIAVECKKAECGDGDLRLVAGGSENSGQLQVCFSQRWGTVNGDGWTAVDTQVACRQLGFNTAGDHYTRRVSKAISIPIYLDNVACHGTEDKLIDCNYHTDTSEDSHSDDIWIDCSNTSTTNAVETNTDRIESQKGSDTGNELDIGLIVAVIALTLSIVVIIILVGYILCRKQSKRSTTSVNNNEGIEGVNPERLDSENRKSSSFVCTNPATYETMGDNTHEMETIYEAPEEVLTTTNNACCDEGSKEGPVAGNVQ